MAGSDLAAKIAAAKAGAAGTAVATPAATVVATPAATPTTPVATPTTPAGGTLAAAAAAAKAAAGGQPAAGAAVGGGNRLQLVRDALKTASVSGGRNDLPLGTGIFLLKSGKLFVTQGGLNISTFSLVCLQGVRDGIGNVFGVEGYSGPVPGESYDESMFQNFEPKRAASTIANNLRVVAACMGWTEEQVKIFKSTPAGEDVIFELMKGMMCIDMESGVATQQPCCFSNQVVVQVSRKAKIVPQKDEAKQPLYDKDGNPATKTYINTFWDKRIPLGDVLTMLGEPATVEAFGTGEAFVAAVENETAMASVA